MDLQVEMDDFLAEFDSEMENLKGELVSTMTAEGEQGVDYAVKNGSYKNHTFKLRRSNKASVTATDDTVELDMENTAEYASYVEAKGYDVLSGGFLDTAKRLEAKL